MKKIISITLVFLSFPAYSQEQYCNSPCQELASAISESDPTFPKLQGSHDELVTWRASRCGIPPKGDGNVIRLCEAYTDNGKSVFYWSKDNNGKIEAGYNECQRVGS